MTISFGWSLDLTDARRRAAAILAATLTLSTLVAPAIASADGYDPATDPDSMYATTLYSGAQAFWAAGYTGAGVDVALIDTGVSRVAGLDGSGKIVYGPDLSLESQAPNLRNLDTNGHGTFMAGLIAGKDDALVAPYAAAPASAYRGMAPDARIVSLKVGVADGGVDVSQVIAAIAWVVQHKNDNGLNIRVINLSYGTDATQAYGLDPLAFAVEQAWKAGIVVIAASGNEGFVRHTGSITNPARDPLILAVGATDSEGTPSMADDTTPAFSASGSPGGRLPDLSAPGAHLQGLRVTGSYLDANNPEGRISGRYFRGSGTSQAAAILSGAAALIIDQRPSIKPDQVKSLLRNTAFPLAVGSKFAMGAGELDLVKVLATSTPSLRAQKVTPSSGTGSLDGARGSDRLTDDGVVLSGEQDIFGHDFDSAAMAEAQAAGNSWSGGTWNGNTWSGNTWSGNTWSGNTWSGNSWSGNTWSGNTWSGNTWSGNTWSGNTWSGNSWSGNTWSGNTWSTGGWN
jgi:serine protease AprX